jgi:uncharacterized protein (TIGR00251 family)
MTVPTQTSTRITVKVVPGSSRDQIVGWLGEALKIKVAAAPERGKANEAVVELLSRKLGISPGDIQIESGHSTPVKVIALRGIDLSAIKETFERE